ncbi:unannotated protein [freshwater metagenome]|uniref:Unannotated protein n=1 Tax=freshwater metagenome TaxID=449393 RepID=A0A6J6D636_9ZZZZ
MACVSAHIDDNVLARRTTHRLMPDASRVISRLFVAGQEDYGASQSRAGLVIERVIGLSEEEVKASLDNVVSRFSHRHENLFEDLEAHAHRVAHRLQPDLTLSSERLRLIGALFTHEFSIEGAALTNPSIVPHPVQEGVEDGALRFIMSVRGVGEGHRSSIGFRTGIVNSSGDITIDEVGDFPVIGSHWESMLHQCNFRGLLEEMQDLGENGRYILEQLGESFSIEDLNRVLFQFLLDRDSFKNVDSTVHHFRMIAERNYVVTFSEQKDLSERILWPVSYAEWRGMEDARFVLFQHDDGTQQYLATYTAFDGMGVSQQLLSTDDFLSFETHPLAGMAARGKGMAFFPRKIGGVFAAMSRADHESNWISFSDRLDYWSALSAIQLPSRPWELIQLGNSGSPIETEAGWLVITHAVGPMRTYHLSAMLLDLNDPARVVGTLDRPLLSPREDERDGYVPNVVYSCGSLMHAGRLVLPYGIADQSIGIATVDMDNLLDELTSKK